MAFDDILKSLKLPQGASDRYRKLEGLERMLAGTFYADLPYAFHQEKDASGNHVPTRERRPSVEFNLAHEIVHDTQAELFGDEQFPTIRCSVNGAANENGTKALADLLEATSLPSVVFDAYEDGVVGGVAVVIHRSDDGTPFYDVLPAKWCEPIYRSQYSNQLIALSVTYPIDRDEAEELFPGLTKEDANKGVETFWYRYVVGPIETIDYIPLSDYRYAHLGETDKNGDVIEFIEHRRSRHGFDGRTPAVYTKNLGGKRRETDGPALWWPIVNMSIALDYTLSQADRGLRYSADPMLFIRKGDLFDQDDTPGGLEAPAGGMATVTAADGSMVKGATQTLVGKGPNADAKLLEIGAAGIKEEREYAKDLREYALEVVGGMKARAEHVKGAASGTAIDKQHKPLRRVVRRQRRPYGDGMLLDLVELTLYGIRVGALEADADVTAIPESSKQTLEWPNDETLSGQDLFYHVQALELASGGSIQKPLQLIKPDVMGAKLAADIGMHEPYETIAGSGESQPDEPDPEDTGKPNPPG